MAFPIEGDSDAARKPKEGQDKDEIDNFQITFILKNF